jgi:MYXO-CTERM domain-containing protein
VRTGADGLVPVAGICEQDRQCADGLCALAGAAGRNVCRVSCDADGDCGDGYRCAEGHCLWSGDGTGTPCDTGETPPPGAECACASSDSAVPAWSLALLLFVGLGLSRRRAR